MIELKMCVCCQGQGPPPPSLLAQAHSGGAGLGLYPILWPYSNGTAGSYSPSLNLAPTVKWVHPENPVTMNSEVSLRRVCLFCFFSIKRKKVGIICE